MLTLIRRLVSRIAAPTSAGVVTAIVIGGAAGAITDSSFLYSTPKVGYFSIHRAAFSPLPVGIRLTQTDNIECLTAPVNLPQGAKMDTITIWHPGTTPNDKLSYFFVREAFATGGSLRLAHLIIDNQNRPRGSVVRPVNNLGSTVDNHHGYAFMACAWNGRYQIIVEGVRIAYRYSSAGD